MGLGNDFENIDKNITETKVLQEEKVKKFKKKNSVIVYQNSIGEERFPSIEAARKYLEELIPEEFSVSVSSEEENEDGEFDEVCYDIEVTIKLIERGL
jgi:hypothetical protein